MSQFGSAAGGHPAMVSWIKTPTNSVVKNMDKDMILIVLGA